MGQNENERTTALGLFHFAHSYANAAISLIQCNSRSTHAESPIRFLFAHSAELYLKAFLRLCSVSVFQLKSRQMGHNFDTLADNAVRFGLPLSDENKKILSTMNGAIFDRYIATGFRWIVSLERTTQLCRELNSEIGPEVYQDAGLSRSPPVL